MTGRAIYRLFDLVARRRVLEALDRLLERQTWDHRRVEGDAAARLERLLRHARARVPFYRGRVPTGGAPALASFPFLEKEVLRRETASLLAEGADPRSMRRTSSGGSTGAPATLLFDRETLDAQTAGVLRHQGWMGLPLACPHLLLWGPPPGVVSYGTVGGRLKGLLIGRRFVPAFDLDEARAVLIRERLRRACPEQVIGYSSALDQVAAPGPPLAGPPRAVVAAAELLYPAQRRRVAAFFGAPVYERYGSNEFASLAHDCRRGSLHLNADRVVFEIVRPDGSAARPGEIGEAVVTDLDNYGMPLIRLRLGDAVEAGGGCDCALPFPTIAAVHGRVGDLIPGAGGRAVSPRHVSEALEGAGAILEHQIRVGQRGALRLFVRARGPFDDRKAAPALLGLFGRPVPVEAAGRIPRWPSGKVRPVAREETP